MDELCYRLLNGTLFSPADVGTAKITYFEFINMLGFPVRLDWVPSKDYPNTSPSAFVLDYVVDDLPVTVDPGAHRVALLPGLFYKVTAKFTGGLVAVFDNKGTIWRPNNSFLVLRAANLNHPNDIGPIPVPTAERGKYPIRPQPAPPVPGSTVLLPPDSPRVVVGAGTAKNKNLILREQYWERNADSVALAPHERRNVGVTNFQGMQQTSSTEKAVSASVDSNVSGGWGSVSASISASLSETSTSFQQVTVTEETTSFVSVELINDHDRPVMYLRWQLTDVITVFDKDKHHPVSSIIQAESPVVVAGPYWTEEPDQVPAVAARRKKPRA